MDTETAPLVIALAPVRADTGVYAEQARTLPIADEPTFTAAAAILVRIKGLRQTVAALFAPHVARAFDAHRALVADRRQLDAPLAEAEAILKRRLAGFTAAENERRRHEAERQMREAHDARTAEVWAAVEQLEATGHTADAATVVSAFLETSAVAPVVVPVPLTAPGLQRREVWRYEVIDATQVPRDYLTIDHAKLHSVVRALKGVVAIPGVRVWVEQTVAARSR